MTVVNRRFYEKNSFERQHQQRRRALLSTHTEMRWGIKKILYYLTQLFWYCNSLVLCATNDNFFTHRFLRFYVVLSPPTYCRYKYSYEERTCRPLVEYSLSVLKKWCLNGPLCFRNRMSIHLCAVLFLVVPVLPCLLPVHPSLRNACYMLPSFFIECFTSTKVKNVWWLFSLFLLPSWLCYPSQVRRQFILPMCNFRWMARVASFPLPIPGTPPSLLPVRVQYILSKVQYTSNLVSTVRYTYYHNATNILKVYKF